MRLKSILLVLSGSVLGIGLFGLSFLAPSVLVEPMEADIGYTLTLSSTNGSIVEESTTETKTATATTSLGSSFRFSHHGLSGAVGGFGIFGAGASLWTPDGVNGLTRVSATVSSGALYVSFAASSRPVDGDWTRPVLLDEDGVATPEGKDFVKVSALEETVVTSVSFRYDCTGLDTSDQEMRLYIPAWYDKAGYCYSWMGEGLEKQEFFGAWPGKAMDKTSDGLWYTCVLEDQPEAKFIFNNNGGAQSSDLTAIGYGDHYFYYDGVSESFHGYKPAAYLLCAKDRFSAETYAYAWRGEDAEKVEFLGGWPGSSMGSLGDWYVMPLDEMEPFKVIFNNNDADQTSNLDCPGNGAYYCNTDELLPWEEGDVARGLTILHCFDWNLATIEANLDAIKAAGYDAVQTSPLQRPKDFVGETTHEDAWWKLYQPLSLNVASDGTSWIGSTSSLSSLTAAAKLRCIKVIVDVVANHLAEGVNASNVDASLQEDFKDDWFHNRDFSADDSSVEHIVQGNAGGRDLNTGNTEVQGLVYDYLKSLIDRGVDGFRFDAAKHIETDCDGYFGSSFWANTLGKAKKYAAGLGRSLFAYGEILGEAAGRKYTDYVTHSYFDGATENGVGFDAFKRLASNLCWEDGKWNHYSGMPSLRNVLWAESHDNYLHNTDGMASASQATADCAYALVAARKGCSALYLPRFDVNTQIGTKSASDPWKSKLVTAANQFHGLLGDAAEDCRAYGQASYIMRYGSGHGYGVVAVNMSDSMAALPLYGRLPEGTYQNLAGDEPYVLSGDTLYVNPHSTYVLYKR